MNVADNAGRRPRKRLTSIVTGGAILLGCTACVVPTNGQAQPATTAAQAPMTVTKTVESTVAPAVVTTTVLLQETSDKPTPSTPVTAPQRETGTLDSEIRSQTAAAFTVVNTYWSDLFAGWEDDAGQPVQWWTPSQLNGDGFYDSAKGDPIDCSGTPGPMNASFCPDFAGSGTVSWDLELFRQEQLFGGGSIYFVVAHEVAHSAQARFHFDGEGGATPNPRDSVAFEQQADCISGATLSKAAEDGYLTVDPSDLGEITAFFSRLEKNGDHGTPQDRLAAFQLGYGTGDVESCLYNHGVPPGGL